MWHRIRYYSGRARELARQGKLATAIAARLRALPDAVAFDARESAVEYAADLPDGFGARRIVIRFSVPALPGRSPFSFSEHVGDTVLAVGTGCFAISRDRGRNWARVDVEQHRRHRFINVKAIGDGEFLMQAHPPQTGASRTEPVDLLLVDERGRVKIKHAALGEQWHGCHGMDRAGGTLMYAEYPINAPVRGRRPRSCRVWRSRDRGRSWSVVMERDDIRHFHFLQARPGAAGEWWLTSGDLPDESRIWVSRDDGDSWTDLTDFPRRKIRVDHERHEHSIFRLTDLAWVDDEILWACDDTLDGSDPWGARAFRSKIAEPLAPALVGRGKWHFRNIVDIGDHLLFISQRSNRRNPPPEDCRPGIYLVPKRPVADAPAMIHLFDLDTHVARSGPGFTFSSASRKAVDGTFFSRRSSEDVFPAGRRILRWDVRLE